MGKRIDPTEIPFVAGTLYPSPFDLPCRARERKKLGDPAGLTQFGVNLLRLPPDAWSGQRHWHTLTDEFIYVLEGRLFWREMTGKRFCARATPPGSRRATLRAIASKTNPKMTP
jgi:uncharacterized cupin superfamily protein